MYMRKRNSPSSNFYFLIMAAPLYTHITETILLCRQLHIDICPIQWCPICIQCMHVHCIPGNTLYAEMCMYTWSAHGNEDDFPYSSCIRSTCSICYLIELINSLMCPVIAFWRPIYWTTCARTGLKKWVSTVGRCMPITIRTGWY